jgi:hypothetical protein
VGRKKQSVRDGETYWAVVEPVWEKIDIYEGPETFVRTYAGAAKTARLLYAAHFCQSEVCNGGFDQFFWNSTGVLGPEAVEGFRAIGMSCTADLVQEAMEQLGEPYPRDREERQARLEGVSQDHLDKLDQEFFKLIVSENGGFARAADKYAGRTAH